MGSWTSVFLFIAGVFISFLGAVSKYLFDKVQDHEKRIQSIEDVQGSKIDQLGEKIKDLRDEFRTDVKAINEKIDALATHIHKEKNQENQLTQAITLLYKHLEKHESRD